MRRSFSLALASLTLGVGSLVLFAQGCTSNALGVQDLCGWIGDECNCYRRFAAGVANSTPGNALENKPLCGVRLDSNGDAIDPATNTLYADQSKKATMGTFLMRDKLDVCILAAGGQVKFDPPLDPLTFPPSNFTFKMIDAQGKPCGDGSYSSITSFSIGFPAPQSTSGGTTSSSSTGGGLGAQCSQTDGEDPSRQPLTSGTFLMAAADPAGIVTTSCPNDEAHRFDLFQLDKCDGSNGSANFKPLLPTAEVEASAGGIGIPGEVRLHIFWPPTAPTDTLDGSKPISVEYFDCTFPGNVSPCLDGMTDGAEVDVDCGFSACGVGCADGANCITDKDCISTICAPNAAGLKKCVSTPCGDGIKKGAETCDDGNTNGGDGCSASCSQEAGFTCPTEGSACVDIDECATHKDNCDLATQDCKNTPGSFTCTCKSGFSLDPMTMACQAGCGDGKKAAPEACDDGNTAKGDGCDPNCAVEKGFTCSGEGPGSCVDIDECKTMTSTCTATETCVNTQGSFMCNCNSPNKLCSMVCINVVNDPLNCGDCGKECKPTEMCMDMGCVPKP